MDMNNLPGPLKLAILIQSLGPEASEQILAVLSDGEREKMKKHLDEMGHISDDLVEKVAKEFAEMVQRAKSRVAIPEKGETKEEQEPASTPANLSAIMSLDADTLFSLIKDEHPQTIAIVLVHVKIDVASEVLSRLSDDMKTDVAFRIANLEKIIGGMVDEIAKVFEEILKNKDTSVTDTKGGIGPLADILNQTDSGSTEIILDELEEQDPELAAMIKQKMFVFEDLVKVDDKGLQKLLRSVETKELATALKAASDPVKEKIFSNMSERAGEMVKDEIEALGTVRMKDVENAQQTITRIIQDLEEKGELIISGRRGEQFIG